MKKVTQEEIAHKINVTSRTIRNWENEKPELLRLVRFAMANERLHIDFWNLFGDIKDFTLMHNFFIDFYFKFLNFFRKNITMPSNNDDIFSTNIIKTFMIYMIQHNKEELIDSEFRLTDIDIENFTRDEFINFIFLKCNKELSEYVLRNTIDDFETLVQDSFGNNRQFIQALKFSALYMVFKYEDKQKFSDKMAIYTNLKKTLDLKTTKDNKYLLKTYLKVKDEFLLKHIDLLDAEPNYKSNLFYVPYMIKRLKKEIHS